MEIVEETQTRLLEIEKSVDVILANTLPREITHIICGEYLTNERVMLERVILETCWKKQKTEDYFKFVDDLHHKLNEMTSKYKTICEYMSELRLVLKSYIVASMGFREAVSAVSWCSGRRNICHRLSCYYSDATQYYQRVGCVCTDPICPADFAS